MYPHQKLDWTISRLEKRLDETPDDVKSRLDLARHLLSRARFHGGGEVWFNKALTQSRRVLQADPASPGALVAAGTALVGLDRTEPALRYLDEALKLAPNRADVHYSLGWLHLRDGNRHQAVRELEIACRQEPDSWEANHLLGVVLAERAAELGQPRRLLERSQFHLVRALQQSPSPKLQGEILAQLALSCLQTERIDEAHKLFTRLLDFEAHKDKARYFLGLCAYKMGKYKNAILFLRQHLDKAPENPHVYARIGMSYLQLGEVVKAREACNRALAIEPAHLQARWTLGVAMLEEGRIDDAIRVFREILGDAPDHMGAFTELLRIRAASNDGRWLRNALRSEVGVHDRLPIRGLREDPTTGRDIPVNPRAATRERIGHILEALRNLPGGAADLDASVQALMSAVDLTTDEGLRYQLWDTALDLVATARAARLSNELEEAGKHFSAEKGREILQLAHVIPEPLLTRGLDVQEADLKRAAVERHGPARSVTAHRQVIDDERHAARAWQAWLLLGIGSRNTQGGRNLLLRWASDADPDLSLAATAALAMQGDTGATARLREQARSKGQAHMVDRMASLVTTQSERYTPRPVSDDEQAHCSTCGRRTHDVGHMMAGASAVICDHCFTEVAKNRIELKLQDPTVACALCGKSSLKARAVYRYQGIPVCSDCVDNSLGLLEREEVDRYLSGLV